MSVTAVILLAAALVLVAATVWPMVSGRLGLDDRARSERRKRRRKQSLRVVDDDSDDFVRAVERDLAALPTIDERDHRKHQS